VSGEAHHSNSSVSTIVPKRTPVHMQRCRPPSATATPTTYTTPTQPQLELPAFAELTPTHHSPLPTHCHSRNEEVPIPPTVIFALRFWQVRASGGSRMNSERIYPHHYHQYHSSPSAIRAAPPSAATSRAS
jgi:hypothetical protein